MRPLFTTVLLVTSLKAVKRNSLTCQVKPRVCDWDFAHRMLADMNVRTSDVSLSRHLFNNLSHR